LIDLRVIQTDSSQINTTDFERKRNAPVVNESDRADAQRRVVAFSLFVSNAGQAPAFFLAVRDFIFAAGRAAFISVSRPLALAPVNSPFIATAHRMAPSGTGFLDSVFHSSREGDHHGNR
jgi:hypothetical protein